MKQNRSHTALLIFAERVQAATRKQLLSDQRKNTDIHKRLLNHTLSKAEKSGLPYYWISDEKQKGNNFQEKLYHSIQDIFDRGYDQLIVIGSDTPQISVQTLLEAECSLSEGSIVMGPSLDGGIYLLGLHKKHFELLKDGIIPWQSGTEAKYIQSLWEYAKLSILVLPKLNDLDSYGDLVFLKSLLSHTSTYAFLFDALHDSNGIIHYYQNREFQIPKSYFQLRAPPQ